MTDRDRLIKLLNVDMSGCEGDYAEEMADYLIKNGVIVLPCKVGDILCCESAIKGHIKYFEVPDLAWIVENKELFGKEIFFSGEEAKKALKERDGSCSQK